MNYGISIRLTALRDTKIIAAEDASGQEVEGIFIPISKNELYVTKQANVYLNIDARECTQWSPKGSHYLVPRMSRELVEERIRLGYTAKTSFIGRMKPYNKY